MQDAETRLRALELEVARLTGIIDTLRAQQQPAVVVLPAPVAAPEPAPWWQRPTITMEPNWQAWCNC